MIHCSKSDLQSNPGRPKPAFDVTPADSLVPPGRTSSVCLAVIVCAWLLPANQAAAAEVDVPDYNDHVAPIFTKYCTGCHNAQDKEGELVLERYSFVVEGGASGPAVVPGQAEKSRLIQVLEKTAEPFMPPEGSEGPSQEEIAVLKAWIRGGAKGPSKPAPDVPLLKTPKIEPVGSVRKPINALAYSPDGKWIAAGRYGAVDVLTSENRESVQTLSGPVGHVNDVGFSPDGQVMWGAGGEAGLYGEVILWSTDDWRRLAEIRGHRDFICAAALSPDGRILATASYDQSIKLWDASSGGELREITGHNGPVFDVAFHPGGAILASAGGDQTVKLWNVKSGERLDTFNETTKEQYAVAFRPDGRYVIAGGVDNRIRAWEIRKDGQEGTNRIVFSRFAHESPILRLAFSADGSVLVSSAEDRTVKLWETEEFTQIGGLDDQPDWAPALAVAPDNTTILVGRLDGTTKIYQTPPHGAAVDRPDPVDVDRLPEPHGTTPDGERPELAELEPNDSHAEAMPISVPATVSGVLLAAGGTAADVDLYRFRANEGQTWMIETNAGRSKSPADTKIEVLHENGKPVLRSLLRAIRDSYITFRPVNSQHNGARLEYWEEMKLNQYLYMNGEIVRLLLAPRGPDSEYNFYAVNGKRRCYFDSSATTHPLDEPVYIVEPYPPDTELADNGLPVFEHYYVNDDDGQRKLGTDSRLAFTAPRDGEFLVRVTDVRGFGGDDYKYSLIVREPKPDFEVSIDGANTRLPAGSGQSLTFTVDRMDNFEGEVRIDVANVPAGYRVTSPVVVEAGHVTATGVINALPHAKPLGEEEWSQVKVSATAGIHGEEVTKDVGNLGVVKLEKKPPAIVHLLPDQPVPPASGGRGGLTELVIQPGETITAMVRIERFDFDGELRFDVENLPHGVIVDNIGLNGIMIREKELERQIFLTAEAWVPETTRPITAVSRSEGKQASLPALLHVRRTR